MSADGQAGIAPERPATTAPIRFENRNALRGPILAYSVKERSSEGITGADRVGHSHGITSRFDVIPVYKQH